jgi:DNA polymerase
MSDEHTELLALLAWYRDMGVTDTVGEVPADWRREAAEFAPAAITGAPARARTAPPDAVTPQRARPAVALGPSPSALPATAPVPARNFPTAPPAAAEQDARAAAAGARSLDELRGILERFDGCALKATAKNLCFFRGAEQSRIMLIGEAPGRDEDLEGKPFVGRAGQLLDRMLTAIELSEADVHITNIVYWRPPGNRTPTPQEAQICRPFLMRQIELVAPEMLVLLGGAAAKHVLGVADGILRIRGKWRDADLGGRTIPAMATLHPAYLLRTPAAKRLAWRDLIAIRKRLGQPGSVAGRG